MDRKENISLNSSEMVFNHIQEDSARPGAVRNDPGATMVQAGANGHVEVNLANSSSSNDCLEFARIAGSEITTDMLMTPADHFPSMYGANVEMNDADALHALSDPFWGMNNSGNSNGLHSSGQLMISPLANSSAASGLALQTDFMLSNNAWTTRPLLTPAMVSLLTENGTLMDDVPLQSLYPVRTISGVAHINGSGVAHLNGYGVAHMNGGGAAHMNGYGVAHMNGGYAVLDEAVPFLEPADQFAQPLASEYRSSTHSLMIPYEHDHGISIPAAADGLQGAFHTGMGMVARNNCVPHDQCYGLTDVMSSIAPEVADSGGTDVAEMANLADRYDPDMSLVWSREEQECLLSCLARYAGDNNEMKYFKIASHLPQKTARDVALRCRWLKDKENAERERLAQNNVARKAKESVTNASNSNHKKRFPSKVSSYSTPSHLIGKNSKLLNRIQEDIMTGQLLHNADHFNQVKVNMDAILQSLSEMRIPMDRLPPSRAPINEELLAAVLSRNTPAPRSPGSSKRR